MLEKNDAFGFSLIDANCRTEGSQNMNTIVLYLHEI